MSATPTEEGLRRACEALVEEDLLALCYGLGQDVRRLRLYQDVLRRRPTERAQFAACLICFDLAQQGDAVAEADFAVLARSLEDVAAQRAWVAEQTADTPYLVAVWQKCEAALADLDPLAPAPTPQDSVPEGHIDLLSDQDFKDFRIEVDDRTLMRRFDEAVEMFLGGVVGVPVYDQSAGFRLAGRRDTERVEAFLSQLDSLAPKVVQARGFRALLLLFLGSHLRPRGLFGALNARKQQLLRQGLGEFFAEAPAVWQVVGVFGSYHAAEDAWPRIVQVVMAYLHWLAADPGNVAQGAGGYDPAGESGLKGR